MAQATASRAILEEDAGGAEGIPFAAAPGFAQAAAQFLGRGWNDVDPTVRARRGVVAAARLVGAVCWQPMWGRGWSDRVLAFGHDLLGADHQSGEEPALHGGRGGRGAWPGRVGTCQ